jgi:MFS family permease
MVAGSAVFAAKRRASLPVLLFFSTLAIAAGYLGMAAAPALALACVGSAVGGAGNGVQWVATISAVQELTSSSMQARVISVLESVASAMPAVGFVAGGLIATVFNPRVAFAFAGLGVIAILFVAVPLLGSKWPVHAAGDPPETAEGDVMVQLIPALRADMSSPNWRSQ